jgi:hypothetical protein
MRKKVLKLEFCKMKRNYIIYSVVIMAVLTVMMGGACKKETEVNKPAVFDSSIDGIAVRSLPAIDIKLAERIVKDGPVSPLADATDESVLKAATATPAPTATLSDSLAGLMPAETPTSSDPNSMF